jgi:hypothetical protein
MESAGRGKRILLVATSNDELGASGKPAGYCAERLVTGQNPRSTRAVAARVVELLA